MYSTLTLTLVILFVTVSSSASSQEEKNNTDNASTIHLLETLMNSLENEEDSELLSAINDNVKVQSKDLNRSDEDRDLIGEDDKDYDDDDDVFTNTFAVELDGDHAVAELIASIYGFEVADVRFLSNVYLFTYANAPRRSKRSTDDVRDRLEKDPHVAYVEQQKRLLRSKRSSPPSEETDDLDKQIKFVFKQVEDEISARTIDKRTKDDIVHFDDPQYYSQWYLTAESRTIRSTNQQRRDLNVGVVWASGYTGKGVVVSVLDDGMEYNHTDLVRNYDPKASTDISDDDDDPWPNFAVSGNNHGTLCAGEIAAEADNGICGVGVAYNSNIGGVRCLDGVITDVTESQALGFGLGYIDVYSASWGPTDNGRKMEAPSYFVTRALLRGVTEGRGGKGSIYVWASGNGGIHDDTCNADGYVSSIYTIAIGSVTAEGESNYFDEPCSSKMGVVYTGGASIKGTGLPSGTVIATDWRNACKVTFGGTSAAAPLIAGCMALVLEANPKITWRDAQHLVVHSARIPSANNKAWYINGAGYHVSHEYGFGVVDCGRMVELSQNWTRVAPQHICHVDDAGVTTAFGEGSTATLQLKTDGCDGTNENIETLEHVEASVQIKHPIRGQIVLVLVSPQGTKSTILKQRKLDINPSGINFTFMSVHFWGEDPSGTWSLEVSDRPLDGEKNQGKIMFWSLKLYGTGGSGQPNRASGTKTKSRQMNRRDLTRTIRSEERKTENTKIRQKRDFNVVNNVTEKVDVTEKMGYVTEKVDGTAKIGDVTKKVDDVTEKVFNETESIRNGTDEIDNEAGKVHDVTEKSEKTQTTSISDKNTETSYDFLEDSLNKAVKYENTQKRADQPPPEENSDLTPEQEKIVQDLIKELEVSKYD